MEREEFEIITKNADGLYNKTTIYKSEDGNFSMSDSGIADILLDGTDDYLDTTNFTEMDLADGHEYGEVFINISDKHKDYEELQELIGSAGCYLDETQTPLSEEEEEDYESFIENLTKDN